MEQYHHHIKQIRWLKTQLRGLVKKDVFDPMTPDRLIRVYWAASCTYGILMGVFSPCMPRYLSHVSANSSAKSCLRWWAACFYSRLRGVRR